MIARPNYLKTKKHLVYLHEVMQLTAASLDRYRFCLRHLLLWAGGIDFRQAPIIRPALPAYLASLPGLNGKGTLAGATQKKVLDTARRFFRWARSAYPRELGSLPVAWIDAVALFDTGEGYRLSFHLDPPASAIQGAMIFPTEGGERIDQVGESWLTLTELPQEPLRLRVGTITYRIEGEWVVEWIAP